MSINREIMVSSVKHLAERGTEKCMYYRVLLLTYEIMSAKYRAGS